MVKNQYFDGKETVMEIMQMIHSWMLMFVLLATILMVNQKVGSRESAKANWIIGTLFFVLIIIGTVFFDLSSLKDKNLAEDQISIIGIVFWSMLFLIVLVYKRLNNRAILELGYKTMVSLVLLGIALSVFIFCCSYFV